MSAEEKHQSAKADADHAEKPHTEDSAIMNACPQCKHVNDASAAFCAECGQPVQIKTPCQFCGTPMYGKQNICEFCGEWLLEGKCRFCEADIDEGQLYCSDCGNLQKSIQCPGCGKDSGFEVCLNCGTPLTPTAKEFFAGLPASLSGVLSASSVTTASHEPSAAPKLASPDQNDELLALKEYKEKLSPSLSDHSTFVKPRKSATLFNDSQKDSIKNLDQEAVVEQRR